MKIKMMQLALGTMIGVTLWQTTDACTRILSNKSKLGVYTARTMDWPESTQPELIVFPRGIKRDGGHVGKNVVAPENPAKWTSKYGSIVVPVYGLGTADGFNEKGLGVHLLYLKSTDFGPRDITKYGLQSALWGQYVLDNAATVEEALILLQNIQPVMIEARGHKATVHLVIEDATGDSAIIEYTNGKSEVHHSHDYRIVTNDPTYEEQLALLKKQDFSKPSSDMQLPGNVNPVDRFQRATYYAALLPEPKDQREAIAGVLAVARNVSVPFGAPYKDMGIYNTEYRTAMDLKKKRYFFELSTSPNLVWIDLDKFKLGKGSPVMALNPDNIDLSGNVSGKFKPAKAPF